MVNSRFYTDTITILRESSTIGQGGELVSSYTTYIDIKGSFQSQSGSWSENNDIRAYRKNKIFYCPVYDSTCGQYTIYNDDMLRYNSIDYEIIDISNQFNHHLEITLQKRST